MVWAQSQSGPVNIPPETPTSELLRGAAQAHDARNFAVAIALLKEVVRREPEHLKAWNALGYSHLLARQPKEAEACFRKQIELNAFDAWAYNNLGLALMEQDKNDDAEAMFRKQLEVNPLDTFANANLGRLLFQQYQRSGASKKKLTEAVQALEVANRLAPKNAGVKLLLAEAYNAAGETVKGKALMAEARAEMPAAFRAPASGDAIATLLLSLKPAEAAIAEATEELERIQQNLTAKVPAELARDDEESSNRAAALWAQMGEAFRSSDDLVKGERYLKAAWLWTQSEAVADRLGQIYEKQGAKAKAIAAYRHALTSFAGSGHSHERLENLLGSKLAADTMVSRNSGELSALRTVKLGASAKKGFGEYVMKLRLTGDTVMVEGVKFETGDLKGMEKAVGAGKYPLAAPSDAEAVMVRRVMLYCGMGACSATLMPALAGMMDKR
ncbi:MAG TPA: tetratricopeptide repeat protein [Bryobacteraceae bacterium]|nr:tetratricopeptide repeat protein [Bryobacteraceae bacterium]